MRFFSVPLFALKWKLNLISRGKVEGDSSELLNAKSEPGKGELRARSGIGRF